MESKQNGNKTGEIVIVIPQRSTLNLNLALERVTVTFTELAHTFHVLHLSLLSSQLRTAYVLISEQRDLSKDKCAFVALACKVSGII